MHPTPAHLLAVCPGERACSLARGIWHLIDPKISLASLSAMTLGAGIAAWTGGFDWGWLWLSVAGILAIEGAKNASVEIVDFRSGVDLAVSDADRTPFSGGKRVLIDGLMSVRQVRLIAAALYVLGAGIGVAIALCREPRVLAVGIAGTLLAWSYHAPPLQLAYRGLGELAVAISYGPLLVAGTVLVQRHAIDGAVIALSLPQAILVGAFLWVNEIPDAAADARSGKHTCVARLGRRRAGRWYAAWIVAAAVAIAALPLCGVPAAALAGAAALIPAVFAARRLWTDAESTARVIPAQVATLLSFVLYAVLAGAALALAA